MFEIGLLTWKKIYATEKKNNINHKAVVFPIVSLTSEAESVNVSTSNNNRPYNKHGEWGAGGKWGGGVAGYLTLT